MKCFEEVLYCRGLTYYMRDNISGDEITRLRHEEHQCVAKMVAGEILVM